MSSPIPALESIEIPLHKLRPWPGNVRKTGGNRNIEELAASIAHHGLLQPPLVKKDKRGQFLVEDGARRFEALTLLQKQGVIPADWPVRCEIAPAKANPTEIGLAANIGQAPMHPADQFEAFWKLHEEGQSIAEIAARFGVSEKVITQRLALARVSPALLDRYRAGEMNLEVLQAFTLTDDHGRQEELWAKLPAYDRKAATIRRLLSETEIPATDGRVRFVGLTAYEAAGGRTKRDLFAEGEQGISLLDGDLLERLLREKLTIRAEELRAEGWKWIEIQVPKDHLALAQCRRLPAPLAPLTAEEQQQIETLQNELVEIEQQGEAAEDSSSDPPIEITDECEEDFDEDDEFDSFDGDEEEGEERTHPLPARRAEIERTLYQLRHQRERVYSDLLKANSGVVVTLQNNGQPEYLYGMVRREDEAALRSVQTETEDQTALPTPAGKVRPERDSQAYSATLIEALTTHKTVALAAELAQQPRVALAALTHTLASQAFPSERHWYGTTSSLEITTKPPNLAAAEGSPAHLFLDEQRQGWQATLPKDADQLFVWCLAQGEETLLRLLAFCLAQTLNGIQAKTDHNHTQRIAHADALGRALQVHMSRWFTPTADNYFSKISKSQIVRALAEAGTPLMVDSASLKKTELAARAEKMIQKTGWLPEPLRITPVPEPPEDGCLTAHADDSETEPPAHQAA